METNIKELDKEYKFDIIRTGSSLSNTFLSLLRTAVVLGGISAVLIRHKKAILFNKILLFTLIILITYSSYIFYIDTKKFYYIDDNSKWHLQLPLYFAALLIILFLLLLFTEFKFY